MKDYILAQKINFSTNLSPKDVFEIATSFFNLYQLSGVFYIEADFNSILSNKDLRYWEYGYFPEPYWEIKFKQIIGADLFETMDDITPFQSFAIKDSGNEINGILPWNDMGTMISVNDFLEYKNRLISKI